MVSKILAQADYDTLKKNAFLAFSKGNYDECLQYIETACRVAYHLNFRFSDFEKSF